MPTQTKSKADMIKELKSLKELLDAGVLTQSEFDEQKAHLLGGEAEMSKELKELKEMLDAGLLTQGEYDEQKKHLMTAG